MLESSAYILIIIVTQTWTQMMIWSLYQTLLNKYIHFFPESAATQGGLHIKEIRTVFVSLNEAQGYLKLSF